MTRGKTVGISQISHFSLELPLPIPLNWEVEVKFLIPPKRDFAAATENPHDTLEIDAAAEVSLFQGEQCPCWVMTGSTKL
jgi:hypothetical protein